MFFACCLPTIFLPKGNLSLSLLDVIDHVLVTSLALWPANQLTSSTHYYRYYLVFHKSKCLWSIPIAIFLSCWRGYCLFFIGFYNLLVRLLHVFHSPYVLCWPFVTSFPSISIQNPIVVGGKASLFFVSCKGTSFHLTASLCISFEGFSSFLLWSFVVEKHFLCFKSILSSLGACLITVFEAGRSIVLTISTLIHHASSYSAWFGLFVSPSIS